MSVEVVVFGRPPEVGRTKRRLAAGIGAVAAAGVYRVLLEATLEQAVATGFQVTLALAGPPAVETAWRPPGGVAVEAQAEGDLGRRMAHAFAARFSTGATVVVLVGTDVPALDAGVMRRAAEACTRCRVVLVPSQDGGYVLVAQRSPGADLFTRVPWSSPGTLAVTRRRLRGLGLEWEELPALRDLDTAADLAAVLADPTFDRRLRERIEAALAIAASARGDGGLGGERP